MDASYEVRGAVVYSILPGIYTTIEGLSSKCDEFLDG